MKIEAAQPEPVIPPVTITLETPEEMAAMYALTGGMNGDATVRVGTSRIHDALDEHFRAYGRLNTSNELGTDAAMRKFAPNVQLRRTGVFGFWIKN